MAKMTYHPLADCVYPYRFLHRPWPEDKPREVHMKEASALLGEIRAWCEGRFIWGVDVRSFTLNLTDFRIDFENETHAFEFRLRWC